MKQRPYVSKSSTGWDGVEREGYSPEAPSNVVRHTLVGGRPPEEVPEDAARPHLELRYFEIPPGAVTRLEKHEHEHYVIVGEGVGQAIVGEEVREVRRHDVVYVAPLVPHQFVNRATERFGIFCVVTAERDYSQRLSPEELARLAASPAGAVMDPDGAPPPRKAAKAAISSV